MPEFDDLSQFSDGFTEGMHVNPIPASEVRRRGDRMRRRNTTLATVGGVVAAAVFIGTPVALMNSGDDGSGPDPAPSVPNPTVTDDAQPPTWLTEIPAQFPVTEGMTDEGEPAEGDTDAFNLCDTSFPTSRGTADTQTWTYSGDGESSATRTFQVWPDDTAAQASVDRLVEGVQACPQQPTLGGEDIIESALVDFSTGGDRSVTFTQQIVADDGLLSQLSTVEVTLVGNAVLVDSSYGSAGGDQAIGIATQILATNSELTRGAMCVFSADPCSTTAITPDSSGAPDPVEETVAVIPADFPLDTGIEPSSDGEFVGPELDAEVFGQVEVCGTPDWDPRATVQRLAVLSTGIEYREARELATFNTTDDAVAAVQDIRDAVTGCPPAEGGLINDVLDGDTGYDSFTWGYSYQEGLGGGVFQLTRVGNAVLVLYVAGETSRESLQGSANDLTAVTQELTPQMCVFTQDGC